MIYGYCRGNGAANCRSVSSIAGTQRLAPELRWGQVVSLTRPKMRHSRIQYRLVELLRPKAEGKGIVAAEVPFRALPEYDLRGADVAFVSQSRWDDADPDDNLPGSPELVIVFCPSNTEARCVKRRHFICQRGRRGLGGRCQAPYRERDEARGGSHCLCGGRLHSASVVRVGSCSEPCFWID